MNAITNNNRCVPDEPQCQVASRIQSVVVIISMNLATPRATHLAADHTIAGMAGQQCS